MFQLEKALGVREWRETQATMESHPLMHRYALLYRTFLFSLAWQEMEVLTGCLTVDKRGYLCMIPPDPGRDPSLSLESSPPPEAGLKVTLLCHPHHQASAAHLFGAAGMLSFPLITFPNNLQDHFT